MAIQLKQLNKGSENVSKSNPNQLNNGANSVSKNNPNQLGSVNRNRSKPTSGDANQLGNVKGNKSNSHNANQLGNVNRNKTNISNVNNSKRQMASTLPISHEIPPNSNISTKDLSTSIKGAKDKSAIISAEAKKDVLAIQKNNFPSDTHKPLVLKQGKSQINSTTPRLQNRNTANMQHQKKVMTQANVNDPAINKPLEREVIKMIVPNKMTQEEQEEFSIAQIKHRHSLGILTNEEIHEWRKHHSMKFQPTIKLTDEEDLKYPDYFVDPSTRPFGGDTYYMKNFSQYQYYTNNDDHRQIYATDKALMNNSLLERRYVKNYKGIYTRSRYYQTYTLKNAGVIIDNQDKHNKYDLKEWKIKGVKHHY